MMRSMGSNRRSDTSMETTARLQPAFTTERQGNTDAMGSAVMATNGYGEYHVPLARRFSSMPASEDGKERVYDIPTLLNLGGGVSHNTRKNEVRFGSDSGFANRSKANSNQSALTEKSVNRRRVSSSLTNGAEDDLQRPRSVNAEYPRRQPVNAPRGAKAQKEAGFARFLKEHASPKHQRVTAGGRIVPMGPRATPAPEFKLPTKQHEDTIHQKADAATFESQSQKDSVQGNNKLGGRSTRQNKSVSLESNDSKTSGSSSVRTTGIAMSNSSTMTKRHESGSSGHSSTSFYSDNQHQGHRSATKGGQGHSAQLSAEARPFNPTCPNFDGGNDQSASAAQPFYPQESMAQYLQEAYPQSIPVTYPSYVSNNMLGMCSYPAVATTAPVQYIPVNNGAEAMMWMPQLQTMVAPLQNVMGNPQGPIGNASLEEITQEHESLSGQLASLDRYMAIHTWDIDPLQKKALVEQRMDLVRKLDTTRTAKEYLESISQSEQATSQRPSHLPGMFPGVQSGTPQYVPVLMGNGVSSGSIVPPAADLQQAVQSERMFAMPMEWVYYANAETFNPGYESYPTEFEVNNRAAPSVACNISTKPASRGNSDNRFGDGSVKRAASIKEKASGKNNDSPEIDEVTAPEEISKVYRKIERAVKDGESLEPYMKELAKAMTRMEIAAPKQINTNTTIQQVHRDGLDYHKKETTMTCADTCQASLENQNDRKKSPVAQRQIRGGDENKRTTPHKATRNRTSAELKLEALYEKILSGNSGSANHVKRADSHSRTRDPAVRARGGDGTVMDKQDWTGNKGHKCSESRSMLKDTASSDMPKQRNSIFNTLSFAPWRQKFTGSPAPKVGIAEAQMINAQGSLPSFDGPGDSKGSEDADKTNIPGYTNIHTSDAGNRDKNSNDGTSDSATKWYQKPARNEHNAMDVRAFFHLLREEDKALLRNHHHTED